jgi:hypothetical protein
MSVFGDRSDAELVVEVDEKWLFEKTAFGQSPLASLTGDPEEGSGHAPVEEKDDTLKASQSSGIITADPSQPDIATPSTPASTRLSGLFHGWRESDARPAPPPSPQVSLINGMAGMGKVRLGLPGFDEFPSDESAPSEPSDGKSNGRSIKESGAAPSQRDTFPSPAGSPTPSSPFAISFTSLSTGTSAGIARLLPQLTGTSTSSTPATASKEGWGKRISLASLGGWTGSASPSIEEDVVTPRAEVASLMSARSSSEGKRMEKQSTGGLWGWWMGSNKAEEGSAEAYILVLKDL